MSSGSLATSKLKDMSLKLGTLSAFLLDGVHYRDEL